jgi:cob(I)alamin adenosyltransferase
MGHLKKGFVHLYTGNGKGKTTAALGLALRAAGAGLKVYIAQFAKGTSTSELKSLKRLSDRITIQQFGGKSFVKANPSGADRFRAAKGMASVKKVIENGRYDVVILDEFCGVCRHHLIPTKEPLAMIAKRPLWVEVILTGRDAPEEVRRLADLVTEMKAIKHYYDKGVKARKGIEY